MKTLAAFAFLTGILITLFGLFEKNKDVLLLYIIAASFCCICAVIMLIDEK